MSAHHLPPTFSPNPDHIPEILKDVCNPSLSIQQVADRLQTPIDSLIIWLTRPDIADLLERYECVCARRARLIVANLLPRLVDIVQTIVTGVHEEEQRLASEPPTSQTIIARRAARSLALNGIRLLTRFAHFGRASKMGAPAMKRAALEHVHSNRINTA